MFTVIRFALCAIFTLAGLIGGAVALWRVNAAMGLVVLLGFLVVGVMVQPAIPTNE